MIKNRSTFQKKKLCGKFALQMNEKVKKNLQIPPFDITGGRFNVLNQT